MHERFRKELERLDFPYASNPPLILTVEEAYGIDTDTYRLKWVFWWVDDEMALPAGFTPCRIDQQTPDGDYVLMILEESGYQDIIEYPCVVPADVLLLAFYGSLVEDDTSFLDER